jgi:hypothetical protein
VVFVSDLAFQFVTNTFPLVLQIGSVACSSEAIRGMMSGEAIALTEITEQDIYIQ